MDITRQNIAAILPEISNLVQCCDFISIDCEFTGLYSSRRAHDLVNYEQYYSKTRDNIETFQIVQVGLTFFQNIDDCKFDCYSYNFFVYPLKCDFLPEDQRERFFSSQSSSLVFLVENGFDFNRLIRDGISYVPLSQLESIEEKIKYKMNDKTKNNFIDIESEEDKKFVQEVSEKITNLINSDQQQIELPQCNSYYRRLIYETIAKSKDKNTLKMSSKNEKLIIKKISNKEEEFKLLMIEHVGFSMIIQLLIKHQKPLIGHNLFIDLLHIYKTFVEPLPSSYEEFKANIRGCFNTIYDTQYIATFPRLKNFIPLTALKKLFEVVNREPFLQTEFCLKNIDETLDQDVDNMHRYHEAGYDSFITGCCFIQMIRYLCAEKKYKNLFDNGIINQFKNKISVYGVYDIKFLDLEHTEQMPNRDHLFHIKFPKTYQRNDLNLLFGEFGGLAKVIWINEESAVCVLKDETQTSKVIETLITNAKNSQPFKIQHYNTYINRDEENETEINDSSQKSMETLEQSPKINKKIKLDLLLLQNSKSEITDKLFEEDYEWPT